LTEKERRALFAAAAEMRAMFWGSPRTYVNIGVEYGASLHCLRAGDPEATLVGIALDISQLEGDPGAQLWMGDSAAYGRRVRRHVHLVFVDGDHHRPGVDDDLRYWSRHIVPGGLLLVHDYSTWVHHADVVAAVDEWHAAHREDWEPLPTVDTLRTFQRLGTQ
jgi:hypothetical protein